ncbi:LuxR family transcriptional regulator [Stappia sp. MMSF_3263]|uniref:LuxR family transcriptional regulator n=1 Tax=Stappia sp. MMSF_3263 TaxID=3046693 RepID=UPI00273DB862|nr:LuxR family transcriptional regulator [Stappia sp. MMSF_3263]
MNEKEIIDVFQAVKAIDQAENISKILDILSVHLTRCGWDACLITHLPTGNLAHWQEHILANGWPEDWYQHYLARGHYRFDPCVARCRRASDPFLWSDIPRRDLDNRARTVMDEAIEFGLRQGVCVPVHAPFSPPLVVSASGKTRDLEPGAADVIGLLARHALQSVGRLRSEMRCFKKPVLSQREQEILCWVACGKTAWEISRILNLSEHTVLSHLRNAKHKLNAANNVHAVVQALLRQEIQP